MNRRFGPPRHAEVVGVLLELIHAETCGRNAPSPALRTAAWRDNLFLAVRLMGPVPIVVGGHSGGGLATTAAARRGLAHRPGSDESNARPWVNEP